MVLGAGVFVLGGAASVTGAHAVAHHDAQQSVQSEAPASTAIASTLQLALQRQQDLDISAGGFVVGDPTASAAEFDSGRHRSGSSSATRT